MAVIIIFNFILALILDDFPKGPMRSFLFSIHKSTGILVIILLIPRLLWRLVNTVPVSLGNIKTLNKLSKYVHYFFYFILLVVVFSGWTYSSARSGPQQDRIFSRIGSSANMGHQQDGVISKIWPSAELSLVISGIGSSAESGHQLD